MIHKNDLLLQITFWAIFILTPYLGYMLLRASRINIRKVSIPAIFFLYYLLVAYAGILPLFYGWFDFAKETGVNDSYRVFVLLVYGSLSLLLILVGFYITSRLTKATYNKHLPMKPLSKSGVLAVITFVIVSIIVGIMFLKVRQQLPLLTAISDPELARVERSDITNNFEGKYHRYSLFFATLLPFCVYILFSNALIKRTKPAWLLFIISLVIAIFFAVADIQKAPLLWLLVGCLLVYQHQKNATYNFKLLFFSILLTAVLIAVMYSLFLGMVDRGVLDIYSMAGQRVLQGGILPAYFYLEMFPGHVDYLYGLSFPNPMNLFPWEPYRLPVEVMNYMYPQLSTMGIVGSAPAVYWAELYANFGPLFPFVVAPILGIILFLFHMQLEKLPNNPVKYALVVWVAMYLMKLAEAGISGYLINTQLIVIIFISALIAVFNRNNKQRI